MTRASRPGPAPRHNYAAVLPGMLAESAKLAAVAERLGVAEATVMHHAKRLGLEPMTPKERRKERVMKMFAAGDCINAIAAVVGCHRNTVINLLSAAGVYRPEVERKRLMSRAERIRLRAAPP